MATFKILGVLVTPVAVELDAAGNITGQHTLPPEFVHWPWGTAAEEVTWRKLAELQPKNDAEPPGQK